MNTVFQFPDLICLLYLNLSISVHCGCFTGKVLVRNVSASAETFLTRMGGFWVNYELVYWGVNYELV